MRVQPKIVKARCGGWFADQDKKRKHQEECEMCQAFIEHESRNMGRVIGTVVVFILTAFVVFVVTIGLRLHGIDIFSF